MAHIYQYATVAEALDELNENGFTHDFNINEKDIVEHPENYEIVHIYRYEGDSSPDDEATVYGIKSIKTGKKGVFVTGFSANSESEAARILLELTIKDRKKH